VKRYVTNALKGWLPSRRPAWAMMPRANAALMIDTLLTAVSVIEQAGVEYTAHQGTLLGAARLGGLLPWDIDVDIAIRGENADSAARKLAAPLAKHGLAFLFSPEHYYYTIRPLAEVAIPGIGRRMIALVPFVEVILLTATDDPATGETWHDRHSPHRMFGPGELLPLVRYPFHGSYVMGPANADPVLARLYGDVGGGGALAHFRPAVLDDATAKFWRDARPLSGDPDVSAIFERARRSRSQWAAHARAAPWYVANGCYNSITETARRFAGGR
jgi:hypothetical protein